MLPDADVKRVFLWTVYCCQGNLGQGALTCSDCFPALADGGLILSKAVAGVRVLAGTVLAGKVAVIPQEPVAPSPSLCLFVWRLNELFPGVVSSGMQSSS